MAGPARSTMVSAMSRMLVRALQVPEWGLENHYKCCFKLDQQINQQLPEHLTEPTAGQRSQSDLPHCYLQGIKRPLRRTGSRRLTLRLRHQRVFILIIRLRISLLGTIRYVKKTSTSNNSPIHRRPHCGLAGEK
jgi:hypothetical protein